MGVICIELIKTSVTYSVVDFYKDIPGNSTPNTCISSSTFWKTAFISFEPTIVWGQLHTILMNSNNSVDLPSWGGERYWQMMY